MAILDGFSLGVLSEDIFRQPFHRHRRIQKCQLRHIDPKCLEQPTPQPSRRQAVYAIGIDRLGNVNVFRRDVKQLSDLILNAAW